MLTLLLLSILFFVGYQIYYDPKGKGLLSFLFYLQIAGFLKRLLLHYEPGIINIVGYNFVVGIQYLFFTIILISTIEKKSKLEVNLKLAFIYAGIFILFLYSSLLSRFQLPLVLILLVLNFFPMLSYLIGRSIDESVFKRLISFLFYTSFLHIGYCILQFLVGPFAFESAFLNDKSSLVDVSTGDFFRSVPLYDNIEPLYIHLAIVFTYCSNRYGIIKLKPSHVLFLRGLIFFTTILMGNRNGMLIFVLILLFEKFHFLFRNKIVTVSFILVVILSLNVFYLALFSVIDDTTVELISNSDLGTRMGTLGTFSDRLVGRKNATEQLNLFGHGLGSSGLITAVFENKFTSVTNAGADFRNHIVWAHDLVGEILIDFGFVGAVFLIFLLITNLLKLNSRMPAVFRIVLSVFIVASLTGSSIFIGRSAYLLFLVYGYGLDRCKSLSNE